jgi:hypothetical protein
MMTEPHKAYRDADGIWWVNDHVTLAEFREIADLEAIKAHRNRRRVGWTLYVPLPVYRDQRTSSDQPGWSGSCQRGKCGLLVVARLPDGRPGLGAPAHRVFYSACSTCQRATAWPSRSAP